MGNMSEWIRDDDFRQSNGGGAVRFKVVFSRAGAPETCMIEATTGNATVEKLVCSLVFKRFGFKPSLDANAKPAYRVLVRSADFRTNRSTPPRIPTPPLFVLAVANPPKNPLVSVVVAVSETGALVGCSPPEYEKMRSLAEAACQAIPAQWKPLTEINASGEPISYVRDIKIELQRTPS